MVENQGRRALSWSMVASFFERSAPALATLLLAPIIGIEQTGIAALSLATVFILSIPFKGVAEVVTGAPDISPGSNKALLIVVLAAGFSLTIGLAISAPLLAEIYDHPSLASIIPVHALAILATSAGTLHDGLFQRSLQFDLQARRKAAGGIFGLIAALVYASAYPSAMALAVYHVVSTVVSSVFCWIMMRPELSASPDWRWVRKSAKALISQPTAQLLGQITIRSIDLITGLILGAYAVGLIRVAMQVYNLITSIFVTPISNYLTGHFSRVSRTGENGGEVEREFLSNYQMLSAFAVPMYGVLGASLPLALSVAMAPEWHLAGELGAVMSLNGVAAVIMLTANSLFVSQNQFALNLVTNAIQAALSIIATVIGAQFGVWGVALSVVVRAYLSTFIVMLMIEQRGKISAGRILIATGPPLICTALAVLVFYVTSLTLPWTARGLFTLAFAYLASAVTYLLSSMIIQREFLDLAKSLLSKPRLAATTALDQDDNNET